jgi:photosystem II stability/assembly factor-like uncharacterized protein
MKSLGSLAIVAFALIQVAQNSQAQWVRQESGTKARFRGLSIASRNVVWASGTNGTVVLTTDGGKTWSKKDVPDATDLDFRDIHAVDDRAAYVLSIGEAEKSRIYKTTDGGSTWTLQYKNPDPKGFLDAIAFWDSEHGLALGDPVDGRYTILTTDDGGKTWTKTSAEGMPEALANEGAFAASGTCLIAQGKQNAWFATGGGKTARVFRSKDRGRTWTVHETPVRAGDTKTGIFSLAFRDGEHGVIVGGTYDQPEAKSKVAATSDDGGKTWNLVDKAGPSGYRSAVSFVDRKDGNRVVAAGPSGTDVSDDNGRTWRPLGQDGFHAVNFLDAETGWAVGEDGLISKFGGPWPTR